MPIHVYVADDHAVVRDGIRYHVERNPNLKWVGESASGVGLEAAILSTHPDILVLDVSMPDFQAVRFVRAFTQKQLAPKVLILTIYDDPELASSLLEAGASGYLRKDAVASDLIRAIEYIARGGQWLDPQVGSAIAARKTRLSTVGFEQSANVEQPAREGSHSLTPREREILTLLAQGTSTDSIASTLFISPATVRTHIKSIYAKIGVSSRAEAVVYATRYF